VSDDTQKIDQLRKDLQMEMELRAIRRATEATSKDVKSLSATVTKLAGRTEHIAGRVEELSHTQRSGPDVSVRTGGDDLQSGGNAHKGNSINIVTSVLAAVLMLLVIALFAFMAARGSL